MEKEQARCAGEQCHTSHTNPVPSWMEILRLTPGGEAWSRTPGSAPERPGTQTHVPLVESQGHVRAGDGADFLPRFKKL